MPQLFDAQKPKKVQPPKIAPLSVLPVFFNMKDSPVLVIGNSAAVAWKVELLLAAGAKVTLIAEQPCAELRDFIDTDENQIIHSSYVWTASDFAEVRLALADFDTKEKASAFVSAAHDNGVSVNIIDQPEFCDFQFGSIVNRSPVVVSISTSGAAPILAQSIRARIETLLPPSVAAWAAKAKSIRTDLVAKVPTPQTRKVIWKEFAQKALSEPSDKIEQFLHTAFASKVSAKTGKVTLVGGGPGDAELLTIKAVRALQSADIILFDKLVSDEVLELARREAKRMLVGKRGGQASCAQDDINELMVKLAKQGKNVVRLKSGDPMIFGRAGEEISILEGEGIPVEIIPGVTSALAIASRLGVSLTHRDCAQSVKFVTAHSRDGELPELDWSTCADETTTLMVYMGARTAPKLAEALMAKGANPQLPVLIAKGISRESEEVTYHRLADLLRIEINRDQPVMLGIGRVFSERCIEFERQTTSETAAHDIRTLTG